MPNERGRIHEHKPPFRKQLSAQAFKVYSFVSLSERHIQNQHMVTVWGLCFQVCNSWHSRFFCWQLSNSVALLRAPPSGLGWIACIRCKASCTEPRCPYHDCSVRIHQGSYRNCKMKFQDFQGLFKYYFFGFQGLKSKITISLLSFKF